MDYGDSRDVIRTLNMRQASWAEPVLTTADELLALPEDGWSYELVEGRLVRMAPTGFSHGRASGRLFIALSRFVEEQGLGTICPQESGFRLTRDPDTVLAPDAAFVRAERLPPADFAGYPELAPDLVVEVVSQTQSMKQMRQKAQTWLRHGVRLIWIVDPASKKVEAVSSGGRTDVFERGQALSGEDVLPGFSLSVNEIFQ
jgi:Uma2 family endonuclease